MESIRGATIDQTYQVKVSDSPEDSSDSKERFPRPNDERRRYIEAYLAQASKYYS